MCSSPEGTLLIPAIPRKPEVENRQKVDWWKKEGSQKENVKILGKNDQGCKTVEITWSTAVQNEEETQKKITQIVNYQFSDIPGVCTVVNKQTGLWFNAKQVYVVPHTLQIPV